jgi:hypothetical protein
VLNNQHAPTPLHRLFAILQQRDAARIIPVMNDMFHDIEVALSRHHLEEISSHLLNPLQLARGFQCRIGSSQDLRKVKKRFECQIAVPINAQSGGSDTRIAVLKTENLEGIELETSHLRMSERWLSPVAPANGAVKLIAPHQNKNINSSRL